MIYHVANRANGRLRPVRKDEDFGAFCNVLLKAHEKYPFGCSAGASCPTTGIRRVAARGRELSRFFGYLGLTHATRWTVAHNAVGRGHVYPGPVQEFHDPAG